MNAEPNPYAASNAEVGKVAKRSYVLKLLPLLLLLIPISCCSGFVYVSMQRAHLQNATHAELEDYGLFAAYVAAQATNIDIQGAPYRGSGSARFKMPGPAFRAWVKKEFNVTPFAIGPPGKELFDAYVGPPAVRGPLTIQNGWYHEEREPRGSGEWFAYDADTGWCYSGWSTH